jgi:hypothetical protein
MDSQEDNAGTRTIPKLLRRCLASTQLDWSAVSPEAEGQVIQSSFFTK